MLKHAALSIVIVLILTASIYAAANMSDPNVFFAPHPRDSMLNENQRLWIKYSDTILRDVFPKTDFSALSDSAKQEIELKWVADLNLPRRYKNDAINGLSLHKSKAAVDGLLSIACDVNTGDNQPRWMAVRALGMLDDISVVPYMAHLVYHYNLNARQWAQVSLVRLTGQNFGSDWRAWGRWWNSQGGNPPFEDKFIPWHPDANWADPAKQIQKDQELFDKLKMLEQIIELKGNLSSIVIDEGRGFNLFQVGQTTCSPFYARYVFGPPENASSTQRRSGTWLNYQKKCGLSFFYKGIMLYDLNLEPGFTGKLRSGITMQSSMQDVFRVYGQPVRTIQTKDFGLESAVLYVSGTRSKILYRNHGVGFYFNNDKVDRAFVFAPSDK